MPAPQFEKRVRELCQQITDCKSERKAIELNRQLQALIHDRIEELRSNLIVFPVFMPDLRKEKKG
jgi:hypothetical protein